MDLLRAAFARGRILLNDGAQAIGVDFTERVHECGCRLEAGRRTVWTHDLKESISHHHTGVVSSYLIKRVKGISLLKSCSIFNNLKIYSSRIFYISHWPYQSIH